MNFLLEEKATHFCVHCGSFFRKDGKFFTHIDYRCGCEHCNSGNGLHKIDFDITIKDIPIYDDDF